MRKRYLLQKMFVGKSKVLIASPLGFLFRSDSTIMLDFFRRHQRYFFLAITVVIIISFSFFGTYSTLNDGSFREQIAFTTIDGTEVPRHELDEMVVFISTDASDKLLFGGAWGPNFLNDGVVRKNFLDTGLGITLALAYPEDVRSDLVSRLEKERRYSLYSHPEAPFIGVEGAWNYFSPQMLAVFNLLKAAQDPLNPDAFRARVALFLMERQLPAPMLKQLLRYQERQYSWLVPDQQLDYLDLSIFGHHTVEDWFGPRFMRLLAQFIINAAEIAEQHGYHVSKAEALADLMRNAQTSYQQNVRSPHLGVANSGEYFSEQLRRLGMDHNKAAKLWSRVLLFRRLFQDLGSSVFVDSLTFEKLNEYALASVEGEMYSLPKAFHLSSYEALQKFEVYLDAISKRSSKSQVTLALPTEFLSVAEILKSSPELVEQKYVLNIAQINKNSLGSKIGIKETWNWEVSDAGWEQLKKQFPELAVRQSDSRDERFAALDSLDNKTRMRLDNAARSAIVDAHPEWIDDALKEAPMIQNIVGMHEKSPSTHFPGLNNGKSLMKLLNEAPLAGQDASALSSSSQEAAAQLARFSADDNIYYRISVISRAAQPAILTFQEADQQGILDKMLTAKLDAYYTSIREVTPKDFQRNDKSWKPLNEVRNIVADRYFEKILTAIRTIVPAAVETNALLNDYAATLRFLPYMQANLAKFQNDPSKIGEWTREASASKLNSEEQVFTPLQSLGDQWKLERRQYQVARSGSDHLIDKSVFDMNDNSWTAVNTPANGDLNFFFLKKKGSESTPQAISSSVQNAHKLLSYDVQQKLMAKLINMFKDSNAISLSYMNQTEESEPAL